MLKALPSAPALVIAIMGASLIEMELERLLKVRLVRYDEDLWTELTEANGPYSGFYAKILMGYALGFYDSNTRHNLDIIRSIRNAFAHAKIVISFDTKLIVDEFRKINLPDDKDSNEYKILHEAKKGSYSNYREAYIALISDIDDRLTGKMLEFAEDIIRDLLSPFTDEQKEASPVLRDAANFLRRDRSKKAVEN